MLIRTIAIGLTFEELVVGYRVSGLGGVNPLHALPLAKKERLSVW